jgi:hypothetical protein
MVLRYLAAGTAAKRCHSNQLLRQQCLLATAQYACSGVADMLTFAAHIRMLAVHAMQLQQAT